MNKPNSFKVRLSFKILMRFIAAVILYLILLLVLFFGGMVQRFGRRAGWVLYFLFLGVCGTTSSWLPVLAHRVPSVSYPALGLGGVVLVLVLGLLGARFLQRSSVQ